MIFNANRTQTELLNQSELSITAHQKICNVDNYCDCPHIERVSEFKYLGLIIDENLKFKSHILKVHKKLQSGIAILHRIKKSASVNLKRRIYFSLVQSHA